MITAKMVNSLRERTGVGIMACKKALQEAEGNEEKAIEILKKKGQAKAAEKSGRSTGEGKVFCEQKGKKTIVVQIACETDFVANNDEIKSFAVSLIAIADEKWAQAALDQWASEITDLIAKIGENIKLEAVEVIESDVSGVYIHSDEKKAAVVSLEWGNEEVAKDIAMHAVAMKPRFLDPSEVSDETVAKEKEIWAVQLKNEGKPENIIENIMKGKEKKFRVEVALKTQISVKDNTVSCEQYAKNNGATIAGFRAFSV